MEPNSEDKQLHFDGRITLSTIISTIGFVGVAVLWMGDFVNSPTANRKDIDRLERQLERDIADIKADIREIKTAQNRHLEAHAEAKDR